MSSVSFYNISIPLPDFQSDDLQQLAQFHLSNGLLVEAHWHKTTKQVVLQDGGNKWFIQPDGPVTRTLSKLLDCQPHNVVVKGLFLFETPGHGKAADQEMAVSFYDCDWSDYACDRIAIQFNAEANRKCETNVQRLIAVVRNLIDEEDYADMPALVPIDSYEEDCCNSCCEHTYSS
jgi:hypothetical protein